MFLLIIVLAASSSFKPYQFSINHHSLKATLINIKEKYYKWLSVFTCSTANEHT